ncbi:MAG TPA: STAS domain-containing protein [Pilimelia sp.]|nr:STAS domain-containing protein [Pilimelia sp.]
MGGRRARHDGPAPDGAPAALRVEPLADRPGFAVYGDVDAQTRPALEAALEATLEHDGDVCVDLAGVSFVDTAGACVLVAVGRSLGPGRRLLLRDPPYGLRRVIELMWGQPRTIEMDAR